MNLILSPNKLASMTVFVTLMTKSVHFKNADVKLLAASQWRVLEGLRGEGHAVMECAINPDCRALTASEERAHKLDMPCQENQNTAILATAE